MTLLEVIWCYILTSTHMIKNHVFFFLQDQLPIKVMFRLNKTIFNIQDLGNKRETRSKETIVKGIRDEQRGRMRRWAHQGHIYHRCILEYVQWILDETPKSSEITGKKLAGSPWNIENTGHIIAFFKFWCSVPKEWELANLFPYSELPRGQI